jgi:hypothetical protein
VSDGFGVRLLKNITATEGVEKWTGSKGATYFFGKLRLRKYFVYKEKMKEVTSVSGS